MTFKAHGVYDNVPVDECINATRKKPIGSRCVDVNKGEEGHKEYRSRRVAKDIRNNFGERIIAAALATCSHNKLLCSRAATGLATSASHVCEKTPLHRCETQPCPLRCCKTSLRIFPLGG